MKKRQFINEEALKTWDTMTKGEQSQVKGGMFTEDTTEVIDELNSTINAIDGSGQVRWPRRIGRLDALEMHKTILE